MKPIPRAVTRPASVLILVAWVAQMATLVDRSYGDDSANLATDLARYGSEAQWRGVYYRGEKIGFTVSQTVATEDGFELHEDGELQMSLLGAITPARIRTTAHVDREFVLHAFDFSLDPGTGPIQVQGRLVDAETAAGAADPSAARPFPDLELTITTASGTRTERRRLAEMPTLALSLPRRLADAGLQTGARYRWNVFDPATLRNAPALVKVGPRELVRIGGGSLPAFRVDTEFVGLETTAWVTDTGEIVREESPLGLLSVREPRDRAMAMAVPTEVRGDLMSASAVVPQMDAPIVEPRDVRRLRLRLDGVDVSGFALDGVGQAFDGDVLELYDLQDRPLEPSAEDVEPYLRAEAFIEADDPDIRAEAEKAVGDASDRRTQAERLTRYVNALLEKKPTVSLPSAREVLRTRIGDCNEHTVLYVAMARALGMPSRIAVGLAYARGAFYYHAWPEVYLDDGARAGWLPVDPTFNQFPIDATHIRLVRGGLDQQAVILPLIGRLRITVLESEISDDALSRLVAGAADLRERNATPASATLLPTGAADPAAEGDDTCWCWWRSRGEGVSR